MPEDLATPIAPTSLRRPARDALLVVAITCFVLILFAGTDIRESGKKMEKGVLRTLVLAVGEPAGWLADRLPFADAEDRVSSWLSPDEELTGGSGFDAPAGGGNGGPAGIDPASFDPAELGDKPRAPRPLKTLLVTGDSLAQPMDTEIARRLTESGDVKTLRDVHVGTGLTKTDLLDWGQLSAQQVRKQSPEAVVLWIGANEGFPLGDIECCGADYAAAYAERARRMMDTYRQKGAARVYWLLLPAPRDGDQARIARTVNAALRVAAQPYRAQVRILDMAAIFTPGFKFRDSMPVDGRDQIVRDPDGIHLNDTGARIAADAVLEAVRRDFTGPAG